MYGKLEIQKEGLLAMGATSNTVHVFKKSEKIVKPEPSKSDGIFSSVYQYLP